MKILPEKLSRKIKRLAYGGFIIFLGLLFYQINEYKTTIMPKICPSGSNTWYCEILTLSLLDFGLKGIAITLLVLGVMIAVLYDFLATLVANLISIAVRHHKVNLELTKDAIKSGNIIGDEKKELIHFIFKNYNKISNIHSLSFAKYLTSTYIDLREQDGGFWRKGYDLNVQIQEFDRDHQLNGKYLNWYETLKYDVYHPEKEKKYNFKSLSSIDYDKDNPNELIEHWEYKVKSDGNVIFDMCSIKDEIIYHFKSGLNFKFTKTLKTGLKTVGKIDVKSSGDNISVSINHKIQIQSGTVKISTVENMPIEKTDDIFVMRLIEPSDGFDLSFSVPDKYKIKNFHVPISHLYNTEHRQDLEQNTRNATFRHNGWLLPGIVSVIEWKQIQTI